MPTDRQIGRRTDMTMLKGVVATHMEEYSTDRDPVEPLFLTASDCTDFS